MSSVRKTFLLPEPLAQALDEEAMASGQSANAILVARLQAESALRRETERLAGEAQRLSAEVARLKADLATRPPPHFRDSMLRLTPGTSKLLDERDAARAECRQLEAALADARKEAEEWRDSCVSCQQDYEASQQAAASLKTHLGDLQELLTARGEDLAEARAAFATEQARRVPVWCRFPLPIPIPVPVLIRLPIPMPWRKGERLFDPVGTGLASLRVLILAALLLLFTPWHLDSRRWLATAMVGTWGDVPAAAARLHGGPLQGHDDLVQLYLLTRARDNPKRFTGCIEKAARHRASKRYSSAVPCTILVPSELELYLDFVTSGPHASSSKVKASMERDRRAPALLAEER